MLMTPIQTLDGRQRHRGAPSYSLSIVLCADLKWKIRSLTARDERATERDTGHKRGRDVGYENTFHAQVSSVHLYVPEYSQGSSALKKHYS